MKSDNLNTSESIENLFSSSLVISEISGSESQDRVIDLKLSEELPNTRPSIKLIPTVSEKGALIAQSEWSKLRSKFSGQSFINGWYYPAVKVDDQNEEELILENDTLPNELNDEVKQLLADTVNSFAKNAEIFQDNLNELKSEIQTLPIFQGALKSLNSCVSDQNTELRKLRDVCDAGMKHLIDKQEETSAVISKIPSNEDYGTKVAEIIQLVGLLKKSVENLEQSSTLDLNELKAQLKVFDPSRFQSSMETIYKAVKKGIEENRERSAGIFESLQGTLSIVEPINKLEILDDLSLELMKSNLNISKLDNKFENIKKKMAIGYCLAMACLGVLIGSCLNLL